MQNIFSSTIIRLYFTFNYQFLSFIESHNYGIGIRRNNIFLSVGSIEICIKRGTFSVTYLQHSTEHFNWTKISLGVCTPFFLLSSMKYYSVTKHESYVHFCSDEFVCLKLKLELTDTNHVQTIPQACAT